MVVVKFLNGVPINVKHIDKYQAMDGNVQNFGNKWSWELDLHQLNVLHQRR
jgi:hypothetical protein